MHVGFDAKRAYQNATGLGNYSRDVLRILAGQHPEHRYAAYAPRLDPRRELPRGVEARGPTSAWGRLFPSLWRTIGLTTQLKADGVELFHGLSNELPVGIERSGVRSVVTIHDLIFERLPELYRPVDRRIYQWKFRGAAERADLVIAISEQTREDLVAYYGVPRERIRVVYQGCHPAFQSESPAAARAELAARWQLPPRFLLSVGTVERRKNLGLTVRALAGLPGIELVVVGRETAYADEVRAEAARLGVAGRIRFIQGLGPVELAALYRLATALVYPSRFEGFGIPIIEALFSGTPVVATRGGVFPEAGGPGTIYVDPDDHEALIETLARLMEDEPARAAMRATGLAHAQRFADQAVAASLMSVYEQVLRGPSSPSRSVS
jgi:glycosyltransferase involved in cell wall biosynthesis